uniref:Inactive serine protease PAMR1 n=1 Tax=Lepisosteus oculatus TaxID=7918 RepID=W5LZU8_LEPOC
KFLCKVIPKSIQYVLLHLTDCSTTMVSEYKFINDNCPGAEWNIMCRGCCEYDQIRCKCPSQGEVVGYAVPCCRNEDNECDPCIFHPGCSIFENCKRCHNGTWGVRDDFFIKGKYCTECRRGWSGGDCMKCGGVINLPRGHITLEGYPNNAHCEWTIQVSPDFNIELRFLMLSLEFDYSCRYDYVEVRDGDSVDSRVIGRFCGNERPAPIRSSGSSLHILFVSDGYKSFDGFFATFEESSACSSSPCLHDGTCLLDTTDSYRCACLGGYTGRHCENMPEEKQCAEPGKPSNGNYLLVYGPGDVLIGSGDAPDTVKFFCNNSYALSGSAQRTCQPDGTWSGKQPQCVKACREPKVSDLVRQKVLPPATQSRTTPVHRLYYSSSALGKLYNVVSPTKPPPAPVELPPGYHHLHSQLQYECASPFYQHTGSARRTCLKTGKWSGRHVTCLPVCGKLPAFNEKKLSETRWPWHVAIYRRTDEASKIKPESEGAWQLICSGALVNQRSVVVAAHCVTDLGKVHVLKAADIKVVVGKHYRNDAKEPKSQQHLRVSAILVHPNYDPLVLDSDMAMLKLLDKAQINERVLPICLPSAQGGEITALQGYVMGWPILPEPGTRDNETTRVGTMELADVVLCESQYAQNGLLVSITDNMFCAREHPQGFSNICPSETGGIAVLPSSSSGLEGQGDFRVVWRLLGLVSWGYDQACSPSLYTVYTRAANFKDWIERNMK